MLKKMPAMPLEQVHTSPHLSNDFEIAIACYKSLLSNEKINPKYKGMNYKEAIIHWLSNHRKELDKGKKEKIAVMLNPITSSKHIDEKYF